MAATSFNAFWDGPDKFSFSQCNRVGSLLHHAAVDYPQQSFSSLFGGTDNISLFEEIQHYSHHQSDPFFYPPRRISTDNSEIIWSEPQQKKDHLNGKLSSSRALQLDTRVSEPLDDDKAALPPLSDQFAIPPFLSQPTPAFSLSSPFPVGVGVGVGVGDIPQPYFPTVAGVGAGVGVGIAAGGAELREGVSGEDTHILSDSNPSIPMPPFSTTPPLVPQRKMKVSTPTKGSRKRDSSDDDNSLEDEDGIDPLQKVCRIPNCLVCNRDIPESLRVPQPSWASILRIVFYTLKISYPQKEFFNLRSHVYDFVDAHWSKICIGKVKAEHWKKQLQDTLAHNKKMFASGAEVYKQKGFWRLDDMADPWEDGNNASGTPLSLSSSLGSTRQLLSLSLSDPLDHTDDDEYHPRTTPKHARKPRPLKRAKVDQPAI